MIARIMMIIGIHINIIIKIKRKKDDDNNEFYIRKNNNK